MRMLYWPARLPIQYHRMVPVFMLYVQRKFGLSKEIKVSTA
jgi:hypothetical protein